MRQFNINSFSSNLISHQKEKEIFIAAMNEKEQAMFTQLVNVLHESLSEKTRKKLEKYLSFSIRYDYSVGSVDYGKWHLYTALKKAFSWEADIEKWISSNKEKSLYPKNVTLVRRDLLSTDDLWAIKNAWASFICVNFDGTISFYEKHLPLIKKKS